MYEYPNSDWRWRSARQAIAKKQREIVAEEVNQLRQVIQQMHALTIGISQTIESQSKQLESMIAEAKAQKLMQEHLQRRIQEKADVEQVWWPEVGQVDENVHAKRDEADEIEVEDVYEEKDVEMHALQIIHDWQVLPAENWVNIHRQFRGVRENRHRLGLLADNVAREEGII